MVLTSLLNKKSHSNQMKILKSLVKYFISMKVNQICILIAALAIFVTNLVHFDKCCKCFPLENERHSHTRGGCKHFFHFFTKAFKALCKLNKIQIFELLIAKEKQSFKSVYPCEFCCCFRNYLVIYTKIYEVCAVQYQEELDW